MTAATAAAAGRRAAERLMVDTCTVTRVTGESLNETTGVLAATTATVYSGACRVRPENTQDSPAEAGERAAMLSRYQVFLPAAVTGVQVDDVVTVTASSQDPGLAGLVATVAGVARATDLTSRRLACVAVTN